MTDTRPYTLPMPMRIGDTQHQTGDLVDLTPDQIARVEACYAEQAPYAEPPAADPEPGAPAWPDALERTPADAPADPDHAALTED